MKKTMPYIAAVILFGAALALQICYAQAAPSLPPTCYDGIYVDLMAQAEYEAWRESKAPLGAIHIMKVDPETGLPVCTVIMQGNSTEVLTSFLHDGAKYDLRFINNVLVGARKSWSEEKAALAARAGASYDTLSDEQQEMIDRQAFEVIWNNQSWETDPEALKPVLDDYAAQVRALSAATRLAETGSKKE